jgi:signal transduction histidine kinase
MMTDTSVARSPFYARQPALFPSPLVQDQLNSEMDHYKQKLDFIHVMSHEVRNPLTVIKAYAKMMLSEQPDDANKEKLQAIADYADVIDHEMAHIISTEQMLATDSLWAIADVELRPIVEEVADTMAIKARTQNVGLHTRIMLADERTPGNAIGLKLIVSNLLSNAIKYSEEGDQVWLEAACAEDGWIELRFRDEGCGMTEEQQQKLFRKYEKTNTDKSGQGIGLFMVKKLLDHFEGTIAIASEPGQGTEVTIRFRPTARPPLPQP